jgi:transposase
MTATPAWPGTPCAVRCARAPRAGRGHRGRHGRRRHLGPAGDRGAAGAEKAADGARAAGRAATGPETLDELSRWFREAAAAGTALNAGRRTAPQKKRCALASRISARESGCLRFARDLRVPFGSNPAEQVIRMARLRIKVSGCMRPMRGAGIFCAIRSCLATAARHGIGWLDALALAAAGTPWIPQTG